MSSWTIFDPFAYLRSNPPASSLLSSHLWVSMSSFFNSLLCPSTVLLQNNRVCVNWLNNIFTRSASVDDYECSPSSSQSSFASCFYCGSLQYTFNTHRLTKSRREEREQQEGDQMRGESDEWATSVTLSSHSQTHESDGSIIACCEKLQRGYHCRRCVYIVLIFLRARLKNRDWQWR